MDEQEGLSSVTSVSESTLGVTVHNNLVCEGQGDEPYSEEDGGEIMVEVVGSDVFVDGVCGDAAEMGQEGSGKGAVGLDEQRDFQSRDADDSSVGAYQEDDGNTGNGVEGPDVAGSSRDLMGSMGTEIVPEVPSETARAVVEQVSEDFEGNAVRRPESVAHAEMTSVDVASSSRDVAETVDSEAERVLEQVGIRSSEKEAEGNVVRSTLSIEGTAAHADLTLQSVEPSNDGVWNPGIEPLVGSSSFPPQDSSNFEANDTGKQRLDFSEKDGSPVKEIVAPVADKYIAGHAGDQMPNNLTGGAVSGDSGVLEKTYPEVETVETNVHDQEIVNFANKDENSHPDDELMETDVYDHHGALLNKDNHNSSQAVVETLETINCDNQTINLCHHVPAGHDYVGVDMSTSQDSARNCADGIVSSRPDSQVFKDKGGDVGAVSGDSEISVGHSRDHSLGANGSNVPSHVGEQELGMEEKLSAENGAISSSCGKADHDEVREVKVDTMHDVDKSDLASHMGTETGNQKIVVSVKGSEVSSSKVPISSDKDGILCGSDKVPDMQPTIADGVGEVAHDDLLLSSEQGSAHDTGNRGAMEIEGDCHETTATLTCSKNDEGLNVDARFENDVRIGPLETSHEPACTSDGEMNTGNDTNKVTHFLSEGLDSDMSLQHTEKDSLLLFDDHGGKDGNPKMSAVSSNDDVMTEVPEGTSLACQDTSKTSESVAVVNGESPPSLEDFNVKVEAKDTALREGSAQDPALDNNIKKCGVTGMHSNIAGDLESTVNQEGEGVVEHAHVVPTEMDHDVRNAATAEVEGAIDSQTATISGADVPLPVRDQIVETCITHTSTDKINEANEDQDPLNGNEGLVIHVHSPEMKVTDEQEKGEVANTAPDSLEQDKGTEESYPVMLAEKSVSMLKLHPGFLIPPENEGEYSISDLVWGKVRSHPWWPGQIFDPSDASEKANKYHKKESFLVAYFGDHTFAWNDASGLRPFWSHFSHIEKQSNSETFQNAVSCALEEVSRRVELGLACSCTPEDSYDKISCQIVENTGIREESSKRYGVDRSTGVSFFGPDNLVHYIKALALSPTFRADRLDLTIAQAQLVAFCRFKGYRLPPEFLLSGELLENDADIPQVDSATDDKGHASEDSGERPISKLSAHKRKHCSKDSSQPKKKERSLSQLMDDKMEREYSKDGEDKSDEKALTSNKKRKAVESLTDGSDKRRSVYAAKVSTTVSVSPKPSFRIGECIQRVASQLTRPAPLLKCSNDQIEADVQLQDSPKGKVANPTESPTPNELLSQLQLVAWAPLKCHNFVKTLTSFFSGYRKSVALRQLTRRQNLSTRIHVGIRRKKASQAAAGHAEEFEFDDVNDSYWTDMIVQNNGEEQQLQNTQNVKGEYSLTVHDPEKSTGRRPYNRKRKPGPDIDVTPRVPSKDIENRKHEPAELILNFVEGGPLPSEMYLNKLFRRFGPLKELETEVRQESSRARVVFKRGSDAEVAHSSVGKFNIFGSRQVTYELSYTPVISFKPMLLTIAPDLEGAI